MKCKFCEEEINLQIWGLPDDICWSCSEQNEVVIRNLRRISEVKGENKSTKKNKKEWKQK